MEPKNEEEMKTIVGKIEERRKVLISYVNVQLV